LLEGALPTVLVIPLLRDLRVKKERERKFRKKSR